MKILIIQNNYPNSTEKFTYKHCQKIKRLSKNVTVNIIDPRKKEVAANLSKTDILICTRFGYSSLIDLKKAIRLKWIHITSAGSNDFAKFLRETKILLTNSSGVHPIPIAEHVFAFLLMFTRRIHQFYRIQVEEKKWFKSPNSFNPIELYQKIIGIIGFGRVGRRIAKLAKGFDMVTVALLHNNKVVNTDTTNSIYKKI